MSGASDGRVRMLMALAVDVPFGLEELQWNEARFSIIKIKQI